jgi:AraC-like DNA-binding protein
MDIAEIALAGFSDQGQMTRVFSKQVGLSPRLGGG